MGCVGYEPMKPGYGYRCRYDTIRIRGYTNFSKFRIWYD